MDTTPMGGYGRWAADLHAGQLPALSLRRGEFDDLGAWRRAARSAVLEAIAPPPLPGPAPVETLHAGEHGGLHVERLRWRLPYGPATEAILVRPPEAAGPLPGVLALHGHGGNKYFGKRKIADAPPLHPLAKTDQQHGYGGRAWANELARRGCVVLAHDSFAFGSRRVRLDDVPPEMRGGLCDPSDGDGEAIAAYNRWAWPHESVLAQGLLVAGTTWSGVAFAEDRAALDVLAARPEVDHRRLACGGLSGGGCRTVFLAGLDPRVRAAFCAGFMTTWRGFLLDVPRLRSWMAVAPRLADKLDFPEILAIRAPAPTMVLNCTDDPLWSLPAMRQAEAILREVFARAGGADRLCVKYYDGGHRFDAPMQGDAFDFLGRWLNAPLAQGEAEASEASA